MNFFKLNLRSMKIKMAYAEQRKVRILEVVTEEMMADP
jgi:hypothetical protein